MLANGKKGALGQYVNAFAARFFLGQDEHGTVRLDVRSTRGDGRSHCGQRLRFEVASHVTPEYNIQDEDDEGDNVGLE